MKVSIESCLVGHPDKKPVSLSKNLYKDIKKYMYGSHFFGPINLFLLPIGILSVGGFKVINYLFVTFKCI